jgi:hypothetical protein
VLGRGDRELRFLGRVQPPMPRLLFRQLHIGFSLATKGRLMLAVVVAHSPREQVPQHLQRPIDAGLPAGRAGALWPHWSR